MTIFKSKPKNQVYLRRKSLKLSNMAVWAACACSMAIGCYLMMTKDQANREVDELSTNTLAVHEPIKYFKLKYLGNDTMDKK